MFGASLFNKITMYRYYVALTQVVDVNSFCLEGWNEGFPFFYSGEHFFRLLRYQDISTIVYAINEANQVKILLTCYYWLHPPRRDVWFPTPYSYRLEEVTKFPDNHQDTPLATSFFSSSAIVVATTQLFNCMILALGDGAGRAHWYVETKFS